MTPTLAVNKSQIVTIIIILIVASVYLWQLGALPLTAYDEAIYSRVIVGLDETNDKMTLWNFGQPWFEKPPLYFWLGYASSQIFGHHEAAYRLPGVIAAMVLLLALYNICRALGVNRPTAMVVCLILASWPYVFITSRQVRLDSLLILFMLIALWSWIKGWSQTKYLWLVFPSLALGAMSKSAAIVPAVFIIIIISLCYGQWQNIRRRELWLGLLPALALWLPWHVYQWYQWGDIFWQQYVSQHVVSRSVQGFGDQRQAFDYIESLWHLGQPWFQLWLASLVGFIYTYVIQRRRDNLPALWLSSYLIVVALLLFYSLARTHIPTYLLPLYPFMALGLGLSIAMWWQQQHLVLVRWLTVICLIAVSGYSLSLATGWNQSILHQLHFPIDQQLKAIGQIVGLADADRRFYQLDWPVGDTLSFYANRPIQTISLVTAKEATLVGPFFLFMTADKLSILYNTDGSLRPEYGNVRLRYADDAFILLEHAADLTIERL